MNRPEYAPVFEESESVIKERLVGQVGEEWRKEPGDFIHDAVVPAAPEVKNLQVNQDTILKNAFAQYAEGDFLDAKLAEVGLTRKRATPNKRNLTIVAKAGVSIPKNYVITQVVLDDGGNPLEYTADDLTLFDADGSKTVAVTCTTVGVIGNIPNGAEFLLSPTVPGVESITDTGTTIPGTDKETDQAAWERYYFKVTNPDTGGNVTDYKRWVDEIEGVGPVKIVPLWNGNGTVKVVLVDSTGSPASEELVAVVQEYLDPDSAGMGYGKAPAGAAVTVVPAVNLALNISATVVLDDDADPAVVKAAFSATVTAYLASLIFSGNPIAYVRIGAMLITTPGVVNYSDLLINDVATDVTPDTDEVATLGTVTLNNG
jgi:uncharacterized phage protein gp47/JayE